MILNGTNFHTLKDQIIENTNFFYEFKIPMEPSCQNIDVLIWFNNKLEGGEPST